MVSTPKEQTRIHDPVNQRVCCTKTHNHATLTGPSRSLAAHSLNTHESYKLMHSPLSSHSKLTALSSPFLVNTQSRNLSRVFIPPSPSPSVATCQSASMHPSPPSPLLLIRPSRSLMSALCHQPVSSLQRIFPRCLQRDLKSTYSNLSLS